MTPSEQFNGKNDQKLEEVILKIAKAAASLKQNTPYQPESKLKTSNLVQCDHLSLTLNVVINLKQVKGTQPI